MKTLVEFINESLSLETTKFINKVQRLKIEIDKSFWSREKMEIFSFIHILDEAIQMLKGMKSLVDFKKIYHIKADNFLNYSDDMLTFLKLPFEKDNIKVISKLFDILKELEISQNERGLCKGFMGIIDEYLHEVIKKVEQGFVIDEEDFLEDANINDNHSEILDAFYAYRNECENGLLKEVNTLIKYLDNKPKTDKLIDMLYSINKSFNKFINVSTSKYYKVVVPGYYDKYKNNFNKGF